MVAKSILATERDLIANGLGQGLVHDYPNDVNDEDDSDDNEDSGNEASHATMPTSHTPGYHHGMVVPVSAATGAGVQRLWLRILHHARLSTIDHTDIDAPSQIPSQINPFAVREHRHAALLRKQDYLRQLSKYRKTETVVRVCR